MTADSAAARRHAPTVLCAGIAVLDQVFRVARFPVPDVKTQASEFLSVNGGNAANAAVAIAHLGGDVRFVAPLGGPPGEDINGDSFLALLARENIDCSACTRMPGVPSPISAISIDARGERAIVNFRDERLAAARPADPAALVAEADAVMADNRFPEFVLPICAAARERGIPVVLDADEPRPHSSDLLTVASHVVFSAEGLRATTGIHDLAAALRRASEVTPSFLAVTDGTNDVLWLDQGAPRGFPSSRSTRSIRSAPAMSFTAPSRWCWPKGAVSAPRSVSPRPRRRSSARASAGSPGRRAGRRSRLSWSPKPGADLTRVHTVPLEIEYYSLYKLSNPAS